MHPQSPMIDSLGREGKPDRGGPDQEQGGQEMAKHQMKKMEIYYAGGSVQTVNVEAWDEDEIVEHVVMHELEGNEVRIDGVRETVQETV